MKKSKTRLLSILVALTFILSTILCSCNPTKPDADSGASDGDGNAVVVIEKPLAE